LKLKSFLVLEIPPVEILVHFCKKHCACITQCLIISSRPICGGSWLIYGFYLWTGRI